MLGNHVLNYGGFLGAIFMIAIFYIEPFISTFQLIRAFRAYPDCEDVNPEELSAVMCMGGSSQDYGEYGIVIMGGND